MRFLTSALLVLALVSGALAAPPPSATPGLPAAGHVLHVDNQNPAASDRNPGTALLPLKTIGRAVQLALGSNAEGRPVTVLIHPGTYRESVSVRDGGTSAAMVFQATEAGKAVISGSDVWTGWRRLGTTPGFAHEWPYNWGLARIPRQWPSLQDIVRRREMVFVNGQWLRQILAPAPLEEGTFSVDEGNKVVYLWPNGGSDPNAATVEVAVRPTLFAASGRANLTVSGLVFEHAATPVDDDAVNFENTTNLLVQDSVFRWNNWGGFGVAQSANVAALRNVANHNGGRGMEVYTIKSLRYADNDTSYNNWRGAQGRFYGWAAAGIKALLVHGGMISNHRAAFNQAHGFWLDTDNENVTITDGVWCGNRTDGAFIEASQGPIAVLRTTMCLNGRAGALIVESANVTIRDSAFYGNGKAQVLVSGDSFRAVTNWETRHAFEVRTQHLTLCGNAIVSNSRDQDVLSMPAWNFLLASLRSTRNVWWSPQNAAPFHVERWPRLDLAGWRRASGQDADSVSADPRFTDPVTWNFVPLAGSLWPKC